jgi:hypothetical protein
MELLVGCPELDRHHLAILGDPPAKRQLEVSDIVATWDEGAHSAAVHVSGDCRLYRSVGKRDDQTHLSSIQRFSRTAKSCW